MEPDERVAREKRPIHRIAIVRGGVLGARSRADIDARFELPDEAQLGMQRMGAAHTQVGQVGRNRGLPTHLSGGLSAVVAVVALESLGRRVDRYIEIAIELYFTA